MNLTRAGVVAGLLASAIALAACSSSGNGGSGGSSQPAGGSGSSAAASGGGGSTQCGSGTLNASGSTAQQNAMNQWIKDYQAACSGTTINYAGVGSGQGITDFTTGKTNFAGSDAALSPDKGEVDAANKECGSPALDIPMVTGPIAVSYNVSGLSNLTLTPDVLAKIFTGKIKTWNDPAIKSINSGANLPSSAISVVFRSDQSGTTQNFETYLNTTDPTDYPTTPSKVWAGVGAGKSGSQGVQDAIKNTQNSIGYLEWSFAGSGGLAIAKIDNGGGAVALTSDSAGAAVASAQPAPNSNTGDLTLKLDYKTTASGAYPIILVTYEVVCSKYKDASIGSGVKAFLQFISSAKEQAVLPSIGYAPLPQSVLTKVQATAASIS